MTGIDIGATAGEVLAAIDSHRQVAPFSTRGPNFGLDLAYAVTAELRRLRTLRGERQIGRKIGFTNPAIWAEYNVHAPIWGDMYDTTTRSLGTPEQLSLSLFVEPRIEPEIVFKLARSLNPQMDERQLLGAIEWVAPGFEIVQSIFPAWRFSAADSIAGNGLHGALLIGPPQTAAALQAPDPVRALADFSVTLYRSADVMDRGRGSNVLGGPVSALRHLVELLGRDPHNPPLRAGEIVTTGTLTRAFPVAAGERWSTRIDGVALEGLQIEFV
jgi:2-oxo-3-hexenedioate decarboxylase